ncbi:MAG: alpha/beta hydrolase-fold protein [Pirellulaceae bacterium]
MKSNGDEQGLGVTVDVPATTEAGDGRFASSAFVLNEDGSRSFRIIGVSLVLTACTCMPVIRADPADHAAGGIAFTVSKHTLLDGVHVLSVDSPYQAGTTTVRVLLPSSLRPGTTCRTLYLLPVEARDGNRYGDGLEEARRTGLADKYSVICIAPTFSHLPWYADHPTDPAIRQETYLLRVVLPAVEQAFPARKEPGSRLLVGFSKSGWGALTLLFRHPDIFGRAAAWDAPLAMSWPSRYGSAEIFADESNFQHYEIGRLLEPSPLRRDAGPRFLLSGYGNFREDMQRVHHRMDELRIPHVYVDGPQRIHDWHSGWLAEAVEWLAGRDGI